ncbi:hypothetical protein BZZ01_03280 [Nostocales cyanobacterium HT-58-2]|nr:hypothetical protein BZZ01_03280 [Nostocales cyanobacterium HT-58-2]
MLSSEGKPTDSAAIGNQVPSTTETQWNQELDCQQVFQLIEKILFFEACLYYQILPFKLEDNKLLLGMVNPQDSAAFDYVNRIVSFMNCTLVTRPIRGETHREILSAYLNYKNRSLSTFSTDITPPKVAAVDEQRSSSASGYLKPHLAQSITEKLGNGEVTDDFFFPSSSSHTLSVSSFPLLPLTPHMISSKIEDLKGVEEKTQQGETEDSNRLYILHIPVPEALSPVNELATLPPKNLLEQLLGRVLSGGIGRLYLERQPYQGRILWSENGVLQSVLEKLSVSVFQGVLTELTCGEFEGR